MAQSLQLETVSPEVGDWLAKIVLGCDKSVRAMMLVNDRGDLLAHGRNANEEAGDLAFEDAGSVLVRIPAMGVTAFVRTDSPSSRQRVYQRVASLLSVPEDYISR